MAGKQGRGGRPPKPLETHRKLGTLRPDRHGASLRDGPTRIVEALEADAEPSRPLGSVGRNLWDSMLGTMPWLGVSDAEMLLMACEVADERAAKRVMVLGGHGTWRDEVALRKLDTLFLDALRELGATPISRARGTLAETMSTLARVRAAEGLASVTAIPLRKDIIVQAAGPGAG